MDLFQNKNFEIEINFESNMIEKFVWWHQICRLSLYLHMQWCQIKQKRKQKQIRNDTPNRVIGTVITDKL